jgi:hypothetical protein
MSTRRLVLVLVLLAIAVGALLWNSGDPPQLDSTDVQLQAESVASLVADGEVLAGIVADDDGYDRATRTHANELAEDLDLAASTLDSAQLPKSEERLGSRVSKVAVDAADVLTDLAAHPGDRSRAKDAQDELGALGTTADAAAKEAAR